MRRSSNEDQLIEELEQWLDEFENSSDWSSTEIARQYAELQRMENEFNQISTVDEGKKEKNQLKNRYVDILPYDRSRVVLQTDDDGDDYINASFVEDFVGHRRYIAAQGPFDRSIVDFCRMIWQMNITTIICLAKEIEGDRLKFRRYWPIDQSSIRIGSFEIFRAKTSNKNFTSTDYDVYPLIIRRNENEERHVLLYHYSQWFDHEIPDRNETIVDLLDDVQRNRQLNDKTPLLVHCSAGCGRTGTFIAMDLCRHWIDHSDLYISSYLVFYISSFIRRYRIALIQTVKQYFFVQKIFHFLIERRRRRRSVVRQTSIDDSSKILRKILQNSFE